MQRLTPKIEVIRALFARSGNQCAFPGCTQPLINDKNQFIGQICHIEAALPNGERYNPNQTNEERRAYDNLVLFCYPHHIETNDLTEYTVEKLISFKRKHETKFEKSDFKIDEAALYKIMIEMESYWVRIERLNKLEHPTADLAFEINAKGSFFDIVKSCQENIDYISSFHDILYESDKELHRNWEIHNLGIPNRMQQLKIDLMHMEIKYWEEFLKTNSKNQEARKHLEYLKEAFAKLAQYVTVID